MEKDWRFAFNGRAFVNVYPAHIDQLFRLQFSDLLKHEKRQVSYDGESSSLHVTQSDDKKSFDVLRSLLSVWRKPLNLKLDDNLTGF